MRALLATAFVHSVPRRTPSFLFDHVASIHGVEESEWSKLQKILASTGVVCDVPLQPALQDLPGVTGRVVCGEMEQAEDIQGAIDQDLYSGEPTFRDPLLLASTSQLLEDMYNLLVVPMTAKKAIDTIPTQVIHVDGSLVDDKWDVSEATVWDGLVSDSLRQELLELIGGGPLPDESKWERGGLVDLPEDSTSCWGLQPEAIEELCESQSPAIQEMESILAGLFPRHTATRLPEEVFGGSVSPLTANAPMKDESFAYHIDGDPYSCPPSPWTDVFGRYMNRSRGKPRFLSALIYLNEEWKEEWGAPTRLLDVPSDTEIKIQPRPGRILLMDQDITHSVTAPLVENRPRYSLVWKLIVHPKEKGQDMMEYPESWPQATLVGSANTDSASWL